MRGERRIKNLHKNIIKAGLTVILLGTGPFLATPAFAGKHKTPTSNGSNTSNQSSRTLAAWNEAYERWAFGELAITIDSNGNAIADNQVVLIPVPDASGDGTPGHLDVTLNAGEAFVLPLWVLLGADHTDATPPTALEPLSVFQALNLTFQIDGVTVVNQANALKFYSVFSFKPPIQVNNSPPINSIIWFQGISIVHAPLPVGTHTFQLDAVNTQPALGGFFEYHDTWTVTVRPK